MCRQAHRERPLRYRFHYEQTGLHFRFGDLVFAVGACKREVASAGFGFASRATYFESIDISTQKFLELIRTLLACKNARDFVTLALKPDHFSYFNFHFHKYPGFAHLSEQSDDDFFESWPQDLGDSPADCLWAQL
jgi:hypothetical protein